MSVAHPADALEARAALRAEFRHWRVRRTALGVGAMFVAISGFLFASPWIWPGAGRHDADALGWLGLGAFWLAVGLVPWARILPMGKDPRFRGDQVRSLDETGFHVRGDDIAFDLGWAAMSRVVETREFFLFFERHSRAHHLSKARMTPEDVEAAARLVSARAGTSSLLRTR